MSQFQTRDGISTVPPPLSQAVGYVVVVVIGVIIALGKTVDISPSSSKLITRSDDAHHKGVEEDHRRRQQ